jgi:hypothetical protein
MNKVFSRDKAEFSIKVESSCWDLIDLVSGVWKIDGKIAKILLVT